MNNLKKTRSFREFQSARKDILDNAKVLEQLLSAQRLGDILRVHGVDFRSRLFCPLTTIWIFMTQVLNADHSCRAAVAQFLATLKSKSCSLSTGAYCQARKRLSEAMLHSIFLAQAEQLQSCVPNKWRWKGRNVRLVDGTTVSMPDTEDNKFYFPATNKKKNPIEFPIARVLVIICKATGVLLGGAIGTYQGKGSGETSLLKQLLPIFKIGDISVFDRYYSGFFSFASLMLKGVDCVSRQHQMRKAKLVKRLGKNDHLFKVEKPWRPPEMSKEEYESYPDEILLRRVRVVVTQPGFRTKAMDVITSLIDESFLIEEIAELYKYRWFVEVDLRSIKSVMGMDVLRCQTAEMVRKEILVHFIAYNFVRAVIMDAAQMHDKEPRQLSFKASLQMIFSFRGKMTLASGKEWSNLYVEILKRLKGEIVGDRPNRYEPRLTKRRHNVKYLTVSRQEARKQCLKQCA